MRFVHYATRVCRYGICAAYIIVTAVCVARVLSSGLRDDDGRDVITATEAMRAVEYTYAFMT